MLTMRRAKAGNCAANARTTMPPRDAPTIAESFSILSERATS
jgi:hypothetical protein